MANSTVPPIPLKTLPLNELGYFSPAWTKWLQFVFTRIGGNIALSNIELATIQTESIDDLEAAVTLLTGRVNNLELEAGGLGVGPVL